MKQAFELACVNKELAAAVKTEVNKELTTLQSLYEEYRKNLLMHDRYSDEGVTPTDPRLVSTKVKWLQFQQDFKSKFKQLMGEALSRDYLKKIESMQNQQKHQSSKADMHQLVMPKFGFTFEDYTLVAHMCRRVCMLSSSMSTLDNWIAKRGNVRLHFPFAQQLRLACIEPEFYFEHTMHSLVLGGKPKVGDLPEDVVEAAKISLNAVALQLNYTMGQDLTFHVALNQVDKSRRSSVGLCMLHKGKLDAPELPFFPSASVPLENSVVGRLDLTDDQIKNARDQVRRHKEALEEEKQAIHNIRLRRFNEDASAWLREHGHSYNIEQVLALLDKGGRTEAKKRWARGAEPMIAERQLGHPIDSPPVLRYLKLLDQQLKLRKKIHELTGEWVSGLRMAILGMEFSLTHWEPIEFKAVEDMDVAVEFVVHKIRTREFKVELLGTSHKDLRWVVNMGRGLKLEERLPGTDEYERVLYNKFDACHISNIFKWYNQMAGVDVTPLSSSKIDKAKELLCNMRNKGTQEKDWGAEFIKSVLDLDAAVRKSGLEGSSNVIFSVFKVRRFPDIEHALENLHLRWATMRFTEMPDKCPITNRDFVLELVGNPLNLPIKYIHRPVSNPQISAEEKAKREEKLKSILLEIPEMEISEDEEGEEDEDEAGPSGYSPTSPEYSPTSPQYEAGEGGGSVDEGCILYDPTSPEYEAGEAPEYHPI